MAKPVAVGSVSAATPLVSDPNRWNAVQGSFAYQHDRIVFQPNVSKKKGSGVGQNLLDIQFATGEIRASIVFADVSRQPVSSCEVMVLSRPDELITAGLGSPFAGAALYSINRWFGERWECLASSGLRDTLKAGREYQITVRKTPRSLELAVDGAKVASVALDFPLPASPVGLWCGGSTSIVVSRFEVIHAHPTAFVIMPFSGEYDEVYSHVIRPTCAELGVDAVRADDILAPGTVLADVEAQIEDSTLVIADVTATNANVFYEVGYARALRKPLELLALKGTELPFDIRSQRVRFYQSSFAGKSDIEKWLRLDISSILQQ